jgi:ABC-type phosphate transport system substrate-binding protein
MSELRDLVIDAQGGIARWNDDGAAIPNPEIADIRIS